MGVRNSCKCPLGHRMLFDLSCELNVAPVSKQGGKVSLLGCVLTSYVSGGDVEVFSIQIRPAKRCSVVHGECCRTATLDERSNCAGNMDDASFTSTGFGRNKGRLPSPLHATFLAAAFSRWRNFGYVPIFGIIHQCNIL